MKKYAVTFVSVLVAVLLIAGGLHLPSVLAQSPVQQDGNGETRRTIRVSGTGAVSVTPDIAFIVVGVRTEAEEASAALSQNNQQTNELINALRQAGITQENIQTQYINLYPRYSDQPGQTGQTQVTGYIATNTVQARVNNISQVGQILDTAVQEGSNLIESIRFDVSDTEAAQQQAREEAFNNARQKAEQLADLASVQLGQVVSITETGGLPPRPFAAGGGAVGAEQAVPVEPGTQDVQIDLQVTWEIAGGPTIFEATTTPRAP